MVLRVSLALLAALVLEAPAAASSSLSYTAGGGTLTVTANDPAVSILLDQRVDTGCTPTCDTRLEVRSAQGLAETPDTAFCNNRGLGSTFLACTPLPASAVVTGSAGTDTLTASGSGAVACPHPAVHLIGLGGIDTLQSGCAGDRLEGGDGADSLAAGDGADVLDGGADADALDGGPGTDALQGGGDADTLVPGTGSDVIAGGPGVDTASYEQRTSPVIVSIGGVADDGEPGEADTIGDDVENLVAGSAGDAVAGSPAANDIDAGPGADSVDAGGGPDVVRAGTGDDAIAARDGAQDRVVCGDGNDRVTADAIDVLEGCEVVDVSRALLADFDADGLAAPEDCDDRDPRRRPGLPDRPGDGLDSDCRDGDARFPRVLTTVSARWEFHAKYLKFTRLELAGVPDQATVELRCDGRGCFKGVKRSRHAAGAKRVKLSRHLARARLRRGAELEVRILRPDTVAKIVTYKVRTGKKDPATLVTCLRPAAKKPQDCATA